MTSSGVEQLKTISVSYRLVYEEISGDVAKYVHEITQHIAQDAGDERLSLSFRCENFPSQSNCTLGYVGPPVTIPLPSYITGIIDADIKLLRQCKNLGCRQEEELSIKLSVLEDDGRHIVNICDIRGMEASNMSKLPFQERLFGMPNIKGLSIAIAPDGRPDGGPSIDKFRLGIGPFGQYPTERCDAPAGF